VQLAVDLAGQEGVQPPLGPLARRRVAQVAQQPGARMQQIVAPTRVRTAPGRLAVPQHRPVWRQGERPVGLGRQLA
jgi:hypothetical protein